MVMSGTVMSMGTPSMMKEKVTVTGSLPSISRLESVIVKPRMKSIVVCAASACACTHAANGPPMMLPKGMELRALTTLLPAFILVPSCIMLRNYRWNELAFLRFCCASSTFFSISIARFDSLRLMFSTRWQCGQCSPLAESSSVMEVEMNVPHLGQLSPGVFC